MGRLNILVWGLVLLLVLPMQSCAVFQAGCEQKEHMMIKLDAPVDQWVAVECRKGAEYVTAGPGQHWVGKDGKEIFFPADGSLVFDRDSIKSSGNSFSRPYTKKLVSYEVKNFNKFFEEEYGYNPAYQDIYLFRIVSDADFVYDFVIYTKDNKADWVNVCFSYCLEEKATWVEVK